MAGMSVPSTAGVMGNVTRLPSSRRDSTCLEDTLIYLGVNRIFHVCISLHTLAGRVEAKVLPQLARSKIVYCINVKKDRKKKKTTLKIIATIRGVSKTAGAICGHSLKYKNV